MRSYLQLLLLVLLAIPGTSIVGCGPSKVSSDVTPENTGDDYVEDNDGSDDE